MSFDIDNNATEAFFLACAVKDKHNGFEDWPNWHISFSPLLINTVAFLILKRVMSLFPPQLLSRKDKSSFDRLAFLMSKEDNYKRLRDFISTQSMVSCIPYLGRNQIETRFQTARVWPVKDSELAADIYGPFANPKVVFTEQNLPVLWKFLQ